MISLRCVILILIGWVMVCGGGSDVIAPCGFRLCRDLCASLRSCSSPDYRVETLSCALRNGSQGVGQEKLRECRTLTSRRGDNVTVCSSVKSSTETSKVKPRRLTQFQSSPEREDPVTPALNDGDSDVSAKDKDVEVKGGKNVAIDSLGKGTPVLLSNNKFALYAGRHKVLFLNDEHKISYVKVNDAAIKSIMAYDPGTLKVIAPEDRMIYAIGVYLNGVMPLLKNCDHLDFVTLCLTEKTLKEAQAFGFKIKA